MLPHCPALLSPFILLVVTAYSGHINDDDDDDDVVVVVCMFRCLTRQKIIDTGYWWTVQQTFVSGISRYIHTYNYMT